MAILRRMFFESVTYGNDDDLWHWLGLDDETGRVFVVSGRSPIDGDHYEKEAELAEFIAMAENDVRTELFALLATLFDDENEDDFVWRRSLI